MNAAGYIVNVGWSQTTHGDTAGLEQVDVLLLDEEFALGGRETGVAEHADLCGDVAPVTGGTELLKSLSQTSSHVYDSVSHCLNTVSPLLVESWILENGINNPASMSWRIGVSCSNDQSHLRLKVYGKILVLEHHSQVTGPLVVQTKVLGERLSTEKLEASVSEISDTPGISVKAAASKALIGAVKEWKVLFALNDIRNLGPLFLGRIYACCIVSSDWLIPVGL